MNCKQARMLRDMYAEKADIRLWKNLTHIEKGRLRFAYLSNEKMAKLPFSYYMRVAGLLC